MRKDLEENLKRKSHKNEEFGAKKIKQTNEQRVSLSLSLSLGQIDRDVRREI